MHSRPSALALAVTILMNAIVFLRFEFGCFSVLRYERSTARPVACTDRFPEPRMFRIPQLPLFQHAPSLYLMACLIHSSMPSRWLGEAPSELPVYGLEFGIFGFAGVTAVS